MTACFSRTGVVAYRDYDKHDKFTEWSGWHSRDAHQSETSQEALLSFVRDLRMHGGADWAEAIKTGLALAYEHMRLEAKTVILLYCDAPPHTEVDGGSIDKFASENEENVFSYLPTFRARTVCNDRLNPARDQLISRFGLRVSRMEDAEKKERLNRLLEASYDFAADIAEMIKAVPDESRYLCVCLEQTVRFSQSENAADDANDDSMESSRDELLEIGRSIPMAMAQQEHGRNFWSLLLHLVLPGTMLAARPAALLAAFSVRMGIQPLQEVAYKELVAWRDNWNTLDIPETWNVNCLSLLLEADQKYWLAVAEGHPGAGSKALLTEEDRELFDVLVSYKLLEMNLDMELMAEVGWSPEKNKAPLGPVVTCQVCQFPRSVTMMAPRCLFSAADTDTTLGTWVECPMKTCRAQYVVYNPPRLHVRPKCHYCRQEGITSKSDPNYETITTAPCVECTKCKSRVIWAAAYRPSSFDPSTYQCPACPAGTPSTIITAEATPLILASENGTAWLLRNDGATIRDRWNLSLQRLLPASIPVALTIRGKPVHNAAALVATLRQWIAARRIQARACSLCFASAAHRDLRLACGGRRRSGHQDAPRPRLRRGDGEGGRMRPRQVRVWEAPADTLGEIYQHMTQVHQT
ncbi:hypothetical protein MYCTH_95235 [Thermothelomyces thermophilus ATCC 42464]|uniref:Uncharacterized protein n=1 Tax=Thermothelomyces thermophilus (strain ATCC 42464 / BCRC 31852 / DSM 1799) TaxID=573729 RepID=G2QH09_THET4|nr:uncharacterized protein MYCTH_95235 [Thermothelomyces thermophilus ATCC 42464]AEO58669.1 hypothetical protein MYCTH_95235 [Thermothelomyces thermophilus ATCC 42464]